MLTGLVAALAGCGLRRFPFDHGSGAEPPGPDDLEVVFVGVGCCLIRCGGTAVLTDPFWSHVPLSKVLFGRVEPDPSQAEGHVPPLDRVQALLIGHGHYDHVLDLPWVLERVHPEAKVLASESVRHQYAASSLARPIEGVDSWWATPSDPGRWWTTPDGGARVLPIRSGHPPQYAGVHLYPKTLTEDAKKPPVRAGDFQEGPSLAFLVDFLRDGAILHRVFVETSTTGPPAGLPPTSTLDERKVDVALLAWDTARLERHHRPSVLDHIAPHTVIALHWENFFRTKDKPPREGMKVHMERVRRALAEGEPSWRYPSWDARFRFPPG